MTANASWTDVLAPATPRRDEPGRPEQAPISRRRSFLTSPDEWITFSILFVAFVAVAASIEEADWVNEMPSLFAASLIGLVTGWLLAHARLPGIVLHPIAIGIGLIVAFGETLHTMTVRNALLANPDLEITWRVRWDELWGRLDDWGVALLDGGISTDPLPFILLVVFLSWAVSYMAAWAVFRWKSGWLAVIPGGFALLTNISYLPGQPSLAFIVFLFAAILLITRLNLLRKQSEWHDEHTARPDWLSLEVLNVATWVGLALILAAWLIPTANNWGPVADAWQRALAPVTDRIDSLGRLFIGIDSKRGNSIHQFGGVLPLQGQITLGDEVLLTVEAPEDTRFIRAAVYDEYTSNGWRLTVEESIPLAGTSVDAASLGTPATRAQFRRAVAVVVTQDRLVADRRLFVAGDALAADVDADLITGGERSDVVALAPHDRIGEGTAYETVGSISAATAETLRSTGFDYPTWVTERYLQLPPSVPPEVFDLARRTVEGAETPYDAARRIEHLLRSEYPFSLDIADPPPGADGVGHFLLVEGRGYFDHHASAMVVMLRSIGVPARIAVGFALDPADYDDDTRTFAVTERRAWAWPEVYFAGLGWVEFNPTPTRPLIQRPGDDSQFGADVVITADPNFDPVEAMLLDEFEVDPSGGLIGSSSVTTEEDGLADTIGSVAGTALTVLVLGAAALVALLLLIRVLWERRFRGLRPASRRWAKLQQFAGWAGIAQPTNRTALESARTISNEVGLDARELDGLAAAFTRERYGSEHAVEENEVEAERLDGEYLAARKRLLRMALRRVLPARRRWRSLTPG